MASGSTITVLFSYGTAVVRKLLFFWVDWLRVLTRKSKSVLSTILNSILLIEKDNRHKNRYNGGNLKLSQ